LTLVADPLDAIASNRDGPGLDDLARIAGRTNARIAPER
jgi:hypothetical protein